MADGDEAIEGGPGVRARIDGMDRLEREIDHQVALLDAIDTKAEHVTRLVILLVGVILTAISIGIRMTGGPPAASVPVRIAFAAGMAGLVATMVTAIVTYLSSRMRLGLHPSTADTFESVDMPMDQYAMLVINAYASVIEDNKAVLDTNSFRFRITLVCLVVAVSYVATAILFYVVPPSRPWGYGGVLLTTVFVVGTGWYVLTGRYLTIQE